MRVGDELPQPHQHDAAAAEAGTCAASESKPSDPIEIDCAPSATRRAARVVAVVHSPGGAAALRAAAGDGGRGELGAEGADVRGGGAAAAGDAQATPAARRDECSSRDDGQDGGDGQDDEPASKRRKARRAAEARVGNEDVAGGGDGVDSTYRPQWT